MIRIGHLTAGILATLSSLQSETSQVIAHPGSSDYGARCAASRRTTSSMLVEVPTTISPATIGRKRGHTVLGMSPQTIRKALRQAHLSELQAFFGRIALTGHCPEWIASAGVFRLIPTCVGWRLHIVAPILRRHKRCGNAFAAALVRRELHNWPPVPGIGRGHRRRSFVAGPIGWTRPQV